MNIKTLCLLLLGFTIETVVCIDKICRTEKPCSVAFKSIGCYKDSISDRVLPNYIYNERDSTHDSYGHRNIDWNNWETYLAGFSCRCAQRANAEGYDLFAIQFYGECWAGKSSSHDYKRLGSSEKCVGDSYQKCGSLDRYCSGEPETNFVYQIIDKCNINFERVGCFQDDHNSGARPLANYVLNDRDKTAKESYSGKDIDWRNYDVYLPEFACRCAKKAQESESTYFGLQFYGECWTHPNGAETYGRDGLSSSCINNCFKPCNNAKSCIGGQNTNYVYRIKLNGHPACDINIIPIGCYKEKTDDRALRTELVNTHPGSELFYGQMPIKGQWKNFFPDFLCKCGHEAKRKGWAYFGVTNFGSCYGDVASENYSKYGTTSTCGEGSASRACSDGSVLCSGADTEANYVYKVTL